MLTLLEQTVEDCCRELEDRLKPLIKEKETIKGEEQAISNQTIMQIIVSDFIPKWTRMRFRLLEQEKDFVIEIYDAQKEQAMKSISVRFKYEYDWGLETWEDALKLNNEDRHKYYTKWTNDGFTSTQIGIHFGVNRFNIHVWLKCSSKELQYAKRNEDYSKSATIAYLRRVWLILEEVGISEYFRNILSDAYNAVTGKSLFIRTKCKRHAGTAISSDIDTCLQVAIDYIQRLICQIKVLNSETYTNKSMREFLRVLSRSTGISLRGKLVYDPNQKCQFVLTNHEGLEKCLVFYNNILEKLNQKRKELEAA